ncbi:MAG: T9SS type A sorting domain-containing protein, partial [Candidatus Marinimicrobia bacterium]|nr:T9SS type A sorting domain-containing protein [Candidatus Neomarinimicrobiota bacterium]
DEHTLTEFVAGGGYLLYSSEEVLGTYGEWGDLYETFSAGHFGYDVLNVEWVGNDYGYEAYYVYDATSLTTDLSSDTLALNVASMPQTGSMADLCDPVGYGTVDQLPSPFIGWTTDYYASSQGDDVAFLGFNLSMMPTDQQQILFANFADWVLGVDEELTMIPNAFTLHQNYPNPFNPVTNIRYDLPEQTHVKLSVFDLLGREVVVLVNKVQIPGAKEVQFDASALASGMYFYQLYYNNSSITKKMVVLK